MIIQNRTNNKRITISDKDWNRLSKTQKSRFEIISNEETAKPSQIVKNNVDQKKVAGDNSAKSLSDAVNKQSAKTVNTRE